MVTSQERQRIIREIVNLLNQTGLVITPEEIGAMEITDFGLGKIGICGAQIVNLVDTDQITAKLIVMLPNQTLPEHKHPAIGGYSGKEETIRCEWGELYLYRPGEPNINPNGSPPEHIRDSYSVWHETIMHPGAQVTLLPNTLHWFQGGPQGAVIWSFSTKVFDKKDVFTDPNIVR